MAKNKCCEVEILHTWLESVLKEQYHFVKRLRHTEKNEIVVLEHNTLHQRMIKRTFTGNAEVYRELLTMQPQGFPEIFEVTEQEGKVTVLEEYIDGVTLFELLQDELYTEKAVRSLVSALCDALTVLHSRNIVHRDIKPENIMIDRSQHMKLIDFDSARIHKPFYPQDTEYLGTAGYAAPEQYDAAATDTRADLFSVGVLMNVLLTGKTPSAQLHHGSLQKVIETCIQVSPDKRFQTAHELKRRLQR